MSSAAPTTRTRDLRFDTLRGLLVLFMALNHIETDLHVVTRQTFGFISSAEGFVFVSGLIAGWVYSRKLREQGPDAARIAARRRAGEIYRMHLLAYFGSFMWMVLFVLITTEVPHLLPWLFAAEPWAAVALGPALFYQPGLLDILPMYCVFMLALPLVLRAVTEGRTVRVLGFSFGLWALAQFASGPIVAFGGLLNLGAFHLLAWQMLFFVGAVLGAHKTLGVTLLRPRAALLAIASGMAALLWLFSHGYVPMPFTPEQFDPLVRKSTLGFIRVANFALLAYLVAICASRFPAAFSWRPLALLGRHTLPVFTAHVLVAMVILTYPDLFFYTPAARWTATAAMVATLFGTALIARWRRDRKISRALAHLARSAPAPRRPGPGWIATAR
jgi:hypothetical protein